MSESVILKTLVFGGKVSLAVIDATSLVNEVIRRHHTSPVASAALGRTMSATAYLCSWLKEEKSELSVTVDGGGPGGKIRVAGDGLLRMRGFCDRPDLFLPPRADGKLDVGGFVGKEGTLTVARDDKEGLPFIGSSPLVSGEIAEDFSYYFLTSEQRPTGVALGVKISPDGSCAGAGGVFLQPLPGAGDETLDLIEAEMPRFANVSSLIEECGAEGILRSFGEDLPFEKREIVFRCKCSRKKVSALLLSLGREEAESILAEQGKITVYCHDCNKRYRYGREQIAALFDRA